MAKPNQMAALDEDFKVGRLESKIKDYEIDLAELQREVNRLQSEANSSSKAFDGSSVIFDAILASDLRGWALP